jgi:hypothetical protein
MLQAIAIKMLLTAVNMLLTKEVFIQIYEAVVAAADLKISGAEKKAKVIKELTDVKDQLKKNFGALSDAVLNMGVELAYIQFNKAIGKL